MKRESKNVKDRGKGRGKEQAKIYPIGLLLMVE